MSAMAYPFFDEYCLSVMLFVSIFFFSSLLTLAQNEKATSLTPIKVLSFDS